MTLALTNASQSQAAQLLRHSSQSSAVSLLTQSTQGIEGDEEGREEKQEMAEGQVQTASVTKLRYKYKLGLEMVDADLRRFTPIIHYLPLMNTRQE